MSRKCCKPRSPRTLGDRSLRPRFPARSRRSQAAAERRDIRRHGVETGNLYIYIYSFFGFIYIFFVLAFACICFCHKPVTNPLLCTDRPSPTQPEQVAWIWWRLRRTHMAPESRPRTLVHIPFFLYVHGFENSRLETFGLSGLGFAFGSLLPTIRCRISLPPRRSLWATSHRRCHGILATSIFVFLPWSGLLQGPIRLDGCIWFLCDFCVLTRVCRAVLGIPPGSTRPARARARGDHLPSTRYLPR